MQQIFEPIFHIIYLILVFYLGFKMVKQSMNLNQESYFKLFGLMAIILGFGDAFHLVPRSYALLTTGLENNTAILGIGKLVTSITVTLFYLLFYKVWKIRFNKNNVKWLDGVMIILVVTRILLCLLPQNNWLTNDPVYSWEVIRNIPFFAIGLLIIYLMIDEAIKNKDNNYLKLAFCVFLSFLFYIPVVFFAQTYPLIGMLMIPKTICYLWIIFITYKELKILKSIK